jgi:CelD/BcsL family acetyltransferase involved in cellulose biosynthesis
MEPLIPERRSWEQWATAAREWTELVDGSPYASFFHSAGWIATWIEVYGPQLKPEILLLRAGARTVAACLLVFRTQRRGPIALRRVYLNACGEDEYEETSLEFNDLLCLPGYEEAAAQALRGVLDARSWDEFIVPGCSASQASDALKQAFGDLALSARTIPSFFVALDAARRARAAFLMSLSGRNRNIIRKSLKLYEAEAPVVTELAENARQAQAHLRELVTLHQESWRARGALGAFYSSRFVRFHETLIDRLFDQGHIQVASVRCGRQLIGALLCFAWRSKVYFYQCGFRYSTDKHLRPGLTTFLLSIERFAEQGWNEFDFMAGDNQYKRVFANQHRDLQWMTFQRPTARISLLRALIRLREAYRWLAHRLRSPGTR